MQHSMEILIPVRNPSTILNDTINSLVGQLDRSFQVLISNNYSTSGLENIEAAIETLTAAGIPVRLIKPEYELSRIQHWNFLHSRAIGTWVKPLFVGDVLYPNYIQAHRKVIDSNLGLQIIRCNFEMKQGTQLIPSYFPFTTDYFSANDFKDNYPKHGNWLGGPVNFIYTKNIWQISGGYSVELPACSDLQLYSSLAAVYGLYSINESLAMFQLHDNRFSFGIYNRKVNGFTEAFVIFRLLKNYYRSKNILFNKKDYRKALKETFNNHYILNIKKNIKTKVKKLLR